jgi:DNA-directed RNA polymerase subunit K/omega
VTIDHLLPKSENKFVLSNALGMRAKQIGEGSLPYVDDFNPANPIITAMKEIAADRIKIKIGKETAKKAKVSLLEEKPKKRLSLAKEKKGKKKKEKKK